MRTWLAAQLNDPTAAGHAYGFCVLTAELIKHWATGAAPDALTLGTGLGMIGLSGAMDFAQGFGKRA